MSGSNTPNTSPFPPHVNLANTTGALFFGGIITSMLYGILCLQMYIFFDRFSKERVLLKYSVAALWLLSSFHIAFTIEPLYLFLIKDFGDFDAILKIPWSITIGSVTTCLTDLIVRCWFTYRVWIISNKCVALTASLVFFDLTAFATGFAVAIRSFITAQSSSSFSKTVWLLYLNYGLCLVADLFIAFCLCYHLYRRKGGLNQRTQSMVNFLMAYAVNTGLFTAMISVAIIAAFALMPDNYIGFAIYFALGPLYVNALMGSLNARDWFRQNTTDHITAPASSFHFAHPTPRDASTGPVAVHHIRPRDEEKPASPLTNDVEKGFQGLDTKVQVERGQELGVPIRLLGDAGTQSSLAQEEASTMNVA